MNLNEMYANLCARLGDLEMNKEHIQAQIEAVKEELRRLNALAELEQKKEQQSEG